MLALCGMIHGRVSKVQVLRRDTSRRMFTSVLVERYLSAFNRDIIAQMYSADFYDVS